MKMNAVDWVAIVLVIIGALNWGLVGFFNYNLITSLFSDGTFTKVVYDLVGLSGLWMIYSASKMGKA